MLALAATPALACSKGDARRTTSNGAVARGDTQPALIPPASTPYTPTTVANGGSVAGTVTFTGAAPRDTVVRPTSDMALCGAQLTDVTVLHQGDRLGGAIVWLEGVRSGKPLPLSRRYEVTQDGCQLEPRVQAALMGGTLNVKSSDRGEHRTRFLRQGTEETVALVTEHDDGEVVPVRTALARPGMIAVRCDQHPWTRGWIAVFDHPYFAVTGTDGSYTIDGVPPGTYTLVAWHERWGRVERKVEVTAGGRVEGPVKFGG